MRNLPELKVVTLAVLNPLKLSRQYGIEDQSGETLFYGGENVGIVCEFIGQGQRAFCINLYDLDGKFVLKFQQQCSSRLCLLCAECGGGVRLSKFSSFIPQQVIIMLVVFTESGRASCEW